MEKEEKRLYLIQYTCLACSYPWEEKWSCACDSECPECGQRNIQAESYEVIEPSEEFA